MEIDSKWIGNGSRLETLSPLTGVIIVVLVVIGFVLTGGSAGYRAPTERVVEYFNESPDRIVLGSYFGRVSIIFLIWFAGSVSSALREREGGSGRLSIVAFGGAVFTSVALVTGFGLLGVGAHLASSSNGISTDVAALLHGLYTTAMAGTFSFGLAVFIGATGVASLRAKTFPDWFGWTSVLMAIGLVTPIHWLIEGLSLIWIALVSIWLFARSG